MEKLVVVDGSNLLFQMFYGMPARIMGKQGRPVHGTVGFLGALLKICRMVEPTHLLVLFDGEYTTPWTDLDPAYKANREDFSLLPEEETPFSQLPDIYRALDYLHIAHCETTVCEADDYIAACAVEWGREGEVVIVSQDSDFFQLITDRVSVLRYRGKQSVVCDPEYIRRKLGINPAQYADFKSLTGDAADNIRGADKIGPKTAAWLLNQFGDLDSILTNADKITKPSVRASILANRERLRKNRAMICLSGIYPLPFEKEELLFAMPELSSTQILKNLGIL